MPTQHGLDITKVEADVNIHAELFDVIAERRKQIAKRSGNRNLRVLIHLSSFLGY